MLAAVARALPGEDLLYLGDTARVPYGTRSPETVLRYSQRVASHLWVRGIKALVVACNTASTHALSALQATGEKEGLPVLGVIEPGIAEATSRSKAGWIGVMGTEGTIDGGHYQAALAAQGIKVSAVACPLLVSLAEEGWCEDPIAIAVAERYLAEMRGGPDTVILGCTHYPLLTAAIGAALPGADLVDSAEATAGALQDLLAERNLLNPRTTGGQKRYLVTDNVDRFLRVGRNFLGEDPLPVELVDLHAPSGLFAEGA